jgi:hypothetical protein
MPFGQELGQGIESICRQLQHDQPLFGLLQAILPPVGAGDGTGDLGARGEPPLDSGLRQLHRLGPRVGGGLHLKELRLGTRRTPLRWHGLIVRPQGAARRR